MDSLFHPSALLWCAVRGDASAAESPLKSVTFSGVVSLSPSAGTFLEDLGEHKDSRRLLFVQPGPCFTI